MNAIDPDDYLPSRRIAQALWDMVLCNTSERGRKTLPDIIDEYIAQQEELLAHASGERPQSTPAEMDEAFLVNMATRRDGAKLLKAILDDAREGRPVRADEDIFRSAWAALQAITTQEESFGNMTAGAIGLAPEDDTGQIGQVRDNLQERHIGAEEAHASLLRAQVMFQRLAEKLGVSLEDKPDLPPLS